MLYWDTSALVKQYLTEPGTPQALTLRAQPEVLHATAIIAYTELFSALRRRVREGVLSEARYRRAIGRFCHDWVAYVRIRLDEEIMGQAAMLIERYPLRTLDAIHLAAALKIQDQMGEPSVMVSADEQLLRAATAEQLAIRRIQP